MLDSVNSEEDSANKSGFKAALPTQIEQLRKELHLSLDVLCDRNQEMFELIAILRTSLTGSIYTKQAYRCYSIKIDYLALAGAAFHVVEQILLCWVARYL